MKISEILKGVMYVSITSLCFALLYISVSFYILAVDKLPEYEARWYKTFESGDKVTESINNITGALMITLPELSGEIRNMNGSLTSIEKDMHVINGSVNSLSNTIPPQMNNMNYNMGRVKDSFTPSGFMGNMFK